MQLKPQLRGLSLSELAPYWNPELGDTITRSNGKKIGYLEFGDPLGKPIFYFHGALSSRIEASLYAESAARNGIRLIGLDRPGIGLSDDTKNFSFIDWPMAVADVADALGIERFSVCGTSGGGAFSCACGIVEKVSRRVDAIILIAGMLPATPDEKKLQSKMVRITFPISKHVPFISWAFHKAISQRVIKPLKSGNMEALKEMDKVIKPGYGYFLANNIMSGQLQGQKGNSRDLALYASPLGFELTNIKIPVLAFSGLKDRNVPSAIASRVVQQVQNGKLIVYDEADHGTIFKHIDDIFEKISLFISDQMDSPKKISG